MQFLVKGLNLQMLVCLKLSSAIKLCVFFFAALLVAHEGLCSEEVPDRVSDKALEEFAYSKTWLNLIYYKKTGGKFKSRVINKLFFADSEKGPTDPVAELRATLKFLTQPAKEDDNHPQCLMPARYRILRKHFELPAPVRCPKLNEWRKSYSPSGIQLVFASQYVSNPASVFGHTFLLVPSPVQAKGYWLTFNYAATIPPETSGVGYIYGGLTGWFKGDYSVMPFYSRIFQYGSIENRDLWVYDVQLSEDEFDLLLSHLWELVHVGSFYYYFLDENCAGILLSTFAAVLPDMRDASELDFYVAPVEVVKTLDKVGRVKGYEVIPSQGNILREGLGRLDAQQRAQFFEAIQKKNGELDHIDAAVSETLIQYTSYQTVKNKGVLPADLKDLERAAHIQRAKFADPPFEPPAKDVATGAPHLSHPSSTFEVGGSSLKGTGVVDIGYSPGLHGLLDDDAGFLKNSSVKFLSLGLSVSRNEIWIRDLTLIQVDNFQEFNQFDPDPSWRVRLAVKENLLSSVPMHQYVNLYSAYGLGTEYGNAYFYGLIASDLNLGREMVQGTFEIGPELGVIYGAGPMKAYVGVHGGSGLFEGSNKEFLKLTSGLRWSLLQDLSLIQKNEWARMMGAGVEGYRMSLALRYLF